VIKSPFEAEVTVIVLDDTSSFEASIDGNNAKVERNNTDIPSTHLLTIRPGFVQGEGGKSGDYEIRLSCV
jgi:hypothetical protein